MKPELNSYKAMDLGFFFPCVRTVVLLKKQSSKKIIKRPGTLVPKKEPKKEIEKILLI